MSHHPHDEALRLIPPDRLRPWARNARTHSKKQVRQIADSIREFGFANPVLIDEDMTILAGHGRAAASVRAPRHVRADGREQHGEEGPGAHGQAVCRLDFP